MYKLSFFVPESHLEIVKEAVFKAGAGKIGHYDSCCWQVKGLGQFRALPGSHPFLGVQGVVEEVEEYKVEMVCDKAHISSVLAVLKTVHPYEEPAFEVVLLEDF